MAKNNSRLSDEERKARILFVADHIINTGDSTRKTAKYISEHYFPISNATVHDYISNRLPKINLNLYEKVKLIIEKNTPKSLELANTRIRIYQAAALLLQNYTISEIVEILNSSYDTIYDDLTNRLPKLDKNLALDVKRILTEHRLNNLSQYSLNIPDEKIEEIVNKGQNK